MATSFGTAATASAAATRNAQSSSNRLPLFRRDFLNSHSKLRLRFSSSSSKDSRSKWNYSVVTKAQLNKQGVDGSSNAAPDTPPESEESSAYSEVKPSIPSEESISEFLSQVSSLAKLVDSSDIAEVRLKQHGCELLLRKKEALVQPQSAYLPPPPPPHTPPVRSHDVPAVQPPPPAPVPTQAPVPSKAKPSEPSLFHTMKCPMAGTFYRSPAPGEPPFVKVGDKVQKGQVLCIVEAMKLMNEIEADQSGTIVEILAEDGKPVSVGTPLFAIKP